jgi:hypothetical protein
MNSKKIIQLAKIKKQLKRARRNVANGKKGARDVESRWQGKHCDVLLKKLVALTVGRAFAD